MIRKLALRGIGDACIGTDEAGNEYHALILLGPLGVQDVEAVLEELGEREFRRIEGLLAINLCQFARSEPALLEHRPNAITR